MGTFGKNISGKRGQGIGTLLNKFAVEQLHTRKIDVDEQNEKAVSFYNKIGYTVVGRTELDSLGNLFLYYKWNMDNS